MLNDFVKLDDIRVIQFGKAFYLLKPYAIFPVLELLFEFFDGNNFSGFYIFCLRDTAEGSIS